MTDTAKIRARLAALRAMTTDRGCTEAEAMAAAEKAAELLASSGLTEAELSAPSYAELGVDIGARRTPLDQVWKYVAMFADCTMWLERRNNRWRCIYFGAEGDILIAEYVHEVILRASKSALSGFRKTPEYTRRRTAKTQAHAQKAFLEGFATSLSVKITEGLWRRHEGIGRQAAAALITHRWDVLRAASGRTFGTARSLAPSRGAFTGDAGARGLQSGKAVSIEAGLGAAGRPAGLLK